MLSTPTAEPGGPNGPAEAMEIRSRPPWAALAWLAGGGLVVLGAGVLFALYRLAVRDALDSLPVDKRLIALASFLPLLAILQLPTIWAWMTGPGALVLGPATFSLDARTVPYEHVACLRHDHGRHLTDIVLRAGRPIRLHWSIWPCHEQWIALLSDRTAGQLLSDARQKLRRGEELEFGRALRLNLQVLTIKGRPMPVRDIAFVHSLTGAAGSDCRHIRIGTLEKTAELNMSKVTNPHVFFALMQELVGVGDPPRRNAAHG